MTDSLCSFHDGQDHKVGFMILFVTDRIIKPCRTVYAHSMTDRIIKSGIERRHYLDSSFHDGQFMILSVTIKILSIVTDRIIKILSVME